MVWKIRFAMPCRYFAAGSGVQAIEPAQSMLDEYEHTGVERIYTDKNDAVVLELHGRVAVRITCVSAVKVLKRRNIVELIEFG